MNGKGLKSKDKTGRYYSFGALAVAIIMISSMAIGTLVITEDGSYDTDHNNAFVSMFESDYIIDTDGTNYYAYNGSKGTIMASSTNFTEIFDMCVFQAKSIYIKPGEYYTNYTLWIDQNSVILRGAGLSHNYGPTEIILGTDSNCNVLNVTKQYCTVEGLMINGNRDNNNAGHGIYGGLSGEGESLTLRDLVVGYCDEDGFYGKAGFESVIINCVFTSCDNNNIRAEQGYKIIGCSIKAGTDNGVSVADCYINNCQIKDNVNGIWFKGNNAMTACKIYANTGKQVYIVGDNNTIIGNQINADSLTTNGVFIHATSEDNIVNNNIVFGSTGDAYYDAGARNIINGLSYNDGAPGSAGNWASLTNEGVFVWDTSASKLYVYGNSTWNILN